MYCKSLELRNFRNYEECFVEFHPKINFFVGENGQGKTSLAEALYILCLGRSFRTKKDKEMIQLGKDRAMVKSLVHKNGRDMRTELLFLRQGGKGIKINGVKKKSRDLANHILMVAFTPEDLKILKEDPDHRRRFLNREISQLHPYYYEALSSYTKILRQRNTLLKSETVDPALLSVWNEELVQVGLRMIEARKSFILRLQEISGAIHSEITQGKETLDLQYESNVPLFPSFSDTKESYRNLLEKKTPLDQIRGMTSVGPHRDDMRVRINGIDVRKFGSQGQQRTASLSLKLAEIQLMKEETGETPILILDDALSELDEIRQQYLIESLKETQVFLTSTSISEKILDNFKEKNIFEINEGKIIKTR